MSDKQFDFFRVMPVGYMTAYSGENVPGGFMEVDGQRLSKSENMRLFNILRGVVSDEGEYFVLPKKQAIFDISKSKFGGVDIKTHKIIMKIA